MLKKRYVDVKLRVVNGGGNYDKKCSRSFWWSHLSLLGKKLLEELFEKNCKFQVGVGFSIFFWHSIWLEVGILKDVFLILFDLSILQDVSIAGMGGWKDKDWHWSDFIIPNSTNLDTVADIARLRQLLLGVAPYASCANRVVWLLSNDGCFSVSSSYGALCLRHVPLGLANQFDIVFSFI